MTKEKTANANSETTVAASPARLYLLSALAQSEDALETLANIAKEHGAQIKKTEILGQKTLAFPVNKKKELILLSVFADMEPKQVVALEKTLRHEEAIERFLITTWDADVNQPPRGRRNTLGRDKEAPASTKEDVQS